MGEDDLKQECLSLIEKADKLLEQACKEHDKVEKRRLRKEARNLEKLADSIMEKINESDIKDPSDRE